MNRHEIKRRLLNDDRKIITIKKKRKKKRKFNLDDIISRNDTHCSTEEVARLARFLSKVNSRVARMQRK